ncbi:MAG: M56 family metallopeptidase [Methylomicrobium sp.]|nr:M56 family metallopeptidase [Methylomicrobium sp.]
MNKRNGVGELRNITLIVIALIWPTLLLLTMTIIGFNGWLRECPMWLEPVGMMVLTALLCTNTLIVMGIFRNILDNHRISRRIDKLPLLDQVIAARLHSALPDLKAVTLRVCAWHEPLAFTTGLRSPAIVLSNWLVENLDHEELVATAAHELAHIQRRDTLLLFWLHSLCPKGWGLRPLQQQIQQLNLLIEKRADSTSIALTGQPMALASALVKVGRHLTMPKAAPILSLTGNNNATLLRQRVALLLNGRETGIGSNWSLGLLLAGLLTSTLLLTSYANTKPCFGWQCDLQTAADPHSTAPHFSPITQ